MNKLIDFDIVKNDLLKPISDKYNIPYNDLVETLYNINKLKTINSRYTCDHNFFSRENEFSFYWAGFIAADGCVFKKGEGRQLIISLSEKDKDHLLKFKNNINFDGNVRKSITKHSLTNSKWNDSIKWTLAISSFHIFEDLKKFNIIPNKTKIYTFPDWLKNHKLANHFMRGYIDGDGSFIEDKIRNRICFELRGNKDFLTDYKFVLESSWNKKSSVSVTTPDSTSKIKYSGKQFVKQAVIYLYKNATIYLPRKYEIAQKALELK